MRFIYRVSDMGGRGGALRFFSFFKSPPDPPPPPPIKTDAPPMVCTPHLKMKPPIWKHPPLHWNVKHPSMKWFLEKAQQRITQNLAKILEKYVWRSSFLVVNLQACRLIKWTPSHVFFDNILSPPHAPPMYWLKLPSPTKFWRASPHVLNTCGKPWFRTYSNMVFFAKIVNGHQSSNTFAKRSVLDVWLDYKCASDIHLNLLKINIGSGKITCS